LSALITSIVFVSSINAILKKTAHNRKNKKPLSLIIVVITSAGIYIGCYAIINYYFNYGVLGTNDWIKEDKLIGHFAVRLTALLLIYSITKFALKNIYNNNVLGFIWDIFVPKEKSKSFLNYDRKDTDIHDYFNLHYFSQIGFYILTIFVAEILIVEGDNLVLMSYFFAFLPIIVDDYIVIHYYFKRFNHMSIFHRRKIRIFNILLFSFSIFSIMLIENYLLMIIYLGLCLTLWLFSPKVTISN